ncbi:MAG: cytochrome c oxidase subunit II [Sphingobacteriaceae bacterium]|nr:MAG: cytochrome c oxidase subunit II [Sphingobacteriaceae bacterium]
MNFKKYLVKTVSAILSLMLLFITNYSIAQSSPTASVNSPTIDEAGGANTMWTGIFYNVLLFLLICVVIAVVGRILKIYDLTLQMQSKKSLDWNRIMAIGFGLFLVVGLYGVYWEYTVQGSMILPEAASLHGQKIDDMFNITLIITSIVLVGTQVMLFAFAYIYRGTQSRKAYFLPHNNTIEKLWTIVPAVVLTILVVFGSITWKNIQDVPAKEQKLALNVDVTAHQFAWEVRYPGRDGQLGLKNSKLVSSSNKVGVDFKDKNSMDDLTADEIVVPVNKPFRVNLIAQDVIHSFYLPWFRVQINAVPGLPTFFQFTPTITTDEMRDKLNNPTFEYKLYCNKICGGNHFNMQKVFRVVKQAEYQDWLSKQKPYLNDQLKKDLKMAVTVPTNSDLKNKLAFNKI